jgi:Na+/proline symporter
MPRTHLATIDWVIIGSYFLTLVAIGLYYRRFASRSMEDYFLSGRRNSGWANGVSYAAAMMNADVAPAYSGLTVVTGLFICWWYLTRFGLALFIGAMLFAVFWRRLNLFTTPEFYELRFGGLASNIIRTWVALRSSLIAMVAWTGTGLLAMYKIAGPVLGISKTNTMLIVIPIVLVYVGIAGFSGVVATAGVQSLIMVIGSTMLCGIVLYAVGGPAELAERAAAVAGSEALQIFPPEHQAVFPLAAVAVYLIGSSIGYGGDTAPLGGAMEGQYLLSSRNTREASKMYIVAEVTLFILLLLVTLPALGALVEWPALRSGGIDREMAYGLLMAKYLPPGMLGLLFVVMLAAVMSTIGSNLNFGAQVLVNDVYRRFLQPGRDDRHYMWIGRVATVLILCLALLVAYNVDLIFQVAIFMLAFSAAELPANWAQWWWWRFNRWGRIAASFGAPVILVAVRLGLPDWQWWNQTYLVIALNTILWITVTLLTPPDSPQVLARFYRKARPLGAWRPVRRMIDANADARDEGTGIDLILKGLGFAVLGAASIALMALGLSHLYVAEYGRGAVELIGFFIGGALFLTSYGKYIDCLEQWAGEISPASRPTSDPGGAVPAEWDLKCTHCAYPLTGLSSRVCPECGEPFDVVKTWEAGHPMEIIGESSVRSTEEVTAAQPAPTSVVVAAATVAYGLIIAILGVIWTQGIDLILNVAAGAAFLLSAALVWWFGRPVPVAPEVAERAPAAV